MDYSKIMIGTAAMFSTIGGFPRPPRSIEAYMENPVFEFVQVFIWAWVFVQDIYVATLIAVGWLLLFYVIRTPTEHNPIDRGQKVGDALQGRSRLGGVV
jgi:hypothetical protein